MDRFIRAPDARCGEEGGNAFANKSKTGNANAGIK
jgi:hypothetical protein